MDRGRRIGIAAASITLGAALLAANPAEAASTTVTGDLIGVAQSSNVKSLTMTVQKTSKSLQLLNARAVKILIDAKSSVKRDGVNVKAAALQATDAISARVSCTFTLSQTSTKISCRAVRISAIAYVPPAPIHFSLVANITAIAGDALTLTNTQFTSGPDAAAIVDPLRASSPLGIHVPTAAQVFLGSDAATFSALTVGQRVTISFICAPAEPYNCRAVRVDIPVTPPQSVVLTGILTLTTQNSVTIDVETVVGRSDASVNVQVLKRKQLQVAVSAATTVTAGGKSGTYSTYSGLTIGVRYTISATCRVDVPFNCAADSIKG